MRLKLIILLIIFLSGCTNFQQQGQDNFNNRNDNRQPHQTRNVKFNDAGENFEQISNNEIADHLANLAASVRGVNDATVVVLGEFTVVGIDVAGELDRSEVSTIKYSVAESLKDDRYGKDAVVFADPDIRERLIEINKDIRAGHPIAGILDELAAITGRIMPELPRELIKPHQENPENSPQKQIEQLNKNEQEEVKQQQQKQSDDSN